MTLKSVSVAVLQPIARAVHRLEIIRRAWFHASLSAKLQIPVDASVVVTGSVEVHGSGRVRMGRNLFLYRELYLETQQEGEIDIGDDVVLSRGVHMCSYASIHIGSGTMIGEYTSIRDANHASGTNESLRNAGHAARPISIGRNVWIGRGCAVLAGVEIGDGAVIGANSVVTRRVAAGSVVAGAPARPLREAIPV
jgi:acetyltransferase-like isoleucine patch superfamily enzyme